MTTAKNEVIQMAYQNPHASKPLFVPVLVICNTPDEVLEHNIRVNSAKDLTWLRAEKEHDGIAVIVGGGCSIREELDNIKMLKANGGIIFAMNGASKWLHEHGVEVDYQCIIDAKPESAMLVDRQAKAHLIGSQVDPRTMDLVENPIVWHLEIGDVERFFPEERKKKGGYVLLGGGTAVGNSSLCAVYALGFRKVHIFGLDSCHRNDESHAYHQDINRFIPTVEVEWGGRKFISSVAMKAQAERFQLTSELLKDMGCTVYVHGDGLLQTMFHTKTSDLTEQQKYQRMWQFDMYRECSPGERIADFYLNRFQPDDLVIDYGCGTGRGALKLHQNGVDVLLIDFADNCRDEEAIGLPFIQWDLTKPIPASSKYGFCTDVMEHLPSEKVEAVIRNIMNSSQEVFFQISTVDDDFGDAIGSSLHLTVENHEWWKQKLESLGYKVNFDLDLEIASIFYITH